MSELLTAEEIEFVRGVLCGERLLAVLAKDVQDTGAAE